MHGEGSNFFISIRFDSIKLCFKAKVLRYVLFSVRICRSFLKEIDFYEIGLELRIILEHKFI